jgi:general secretion pathway protein J
MKKSLCDMLADEAGFTLMEALLATLLMAVILAALTTVTGQWLPNWNRGMARVQRAERLATGIDRIVKDLSVAEMMTINSEIKTPLFEGSESSVLFLRTAVGPNSKPGLDIVRLIEKPDDQSVAMVREHAAFMPMSASAQIKLGDPVVLIRAPFRVTFSYAGPDQVWQATWSGQPQLPSVVRIAVRDGANGKVLAVSSASLVRINASAECARSKNPLECFAGKEQSDAPK